MEEVFEAEISSKEHQQHAGSLRDNKGADSVHDLLIYLFIGLSIYLSVYLTT